jgi:hypothetical protein
LLVQIPQSHFRHSREDSSARSSSNREQVCEVLDGLLQSTALHLRYQDQAIAVGGWLPREIYVGRHNDRGRIIQGMRLNPHIAVLFRP